MLAFAFSYVLGSFVYGQHNAATLCRCAGVKDLQEKGYTCSSKELKEGRRWCYVFPDSNCDNMQAPVPGLLASPNFAWVFCDEQKDMVETPCNHDDIMYQNHKSSCSTWADQDFCEAGSQFNRFMWTWCCHNCEVWEEEQKNEKQLQDKCVDLDDGCEGWAKAGYCTGGSFDYKAKYLQFMQDTCCLACREKANELDSDREPTCADTWSYCDELGSTVCDDPNSKIHCKKYCDECELMDPEWCNHNEIIVDGYTYQAEGTDWTAGRSIEDATLKIAPLNNEDLCENPPDDNYFQGMVAVVMRGNCFFSLKVEIAQQNGAVGIIVVDNVVDTEPLRMYKVNSFDDGKIPAVAVTWESGRHIMDWIEGRKGRAKVSFVCPHCHDESTQCESYKEQDICESSKNEMHSVCAATCGFCELEFPTARPSVDSNSWQANFWERVGDGKCMTPYGDMPNHKYISAKRQKCQAACVHEMNCHAYSHSGEGNNCILWLEEVAGSTGKSVDFPFECWKRMVPTENFTLVGQGWCRGGKNGDKRVKCKAKDDMTYVSCMEECHLEGNKCLGFDIGLEGTTWAGRCHVYGDQLEAKGYWKQEEWEILHKDEYGNELEMNINNSNGYEDYVCYTNKRSGCSCTGESRPVCDLANRENYINECLAKCNGVTETVPGRCPKERCGCDRDVKPVCFEGNVQFTNSCHAKCEGIKSDEFEEGECKVNRDINTVPASVNGKFKVYREWCEAFETETGCSSCSGKWKRKNDRCVIKKPARIRCKSIVEKAICKLAECEWSNGRRRCTGNSGLQ